MEKIETIISLSLKKSILKIRSKECSMLYNYNYQDMPNTKSVNMQFDRSQPYTYLTSFAFMSTVDYYNYHINDDAADCSMIIYSGEIDSMKDLYLLYQILKFLLILIILILYILLLKIILSKE